MSEVKPGMEIMHHQQTISWTDPQGLVTTWHFDTASEGVSVSERGISGYIHNHRVMAPRPRRYDVVILTVFVCGADGIRYGTEAELYEALMVDFSRGPWADYG